MALIFGGSSGAAPRVLVELRIPDVLLHLAEYAVLGFLASRWLLHWRLRTGPGALILAPPPPCAWRKSCYRPQR